MKKLLLASLAVAMLSGLAWSDNLTVKAPVTDRGVAVHPLYGGFKYAYINGGTETAVCTGRCLLAELIMSTGATTLFFRVRDTGTVAAYTTYALPFIRFSDVDTIARLPLLHRPIRSDTGWTIQIVGGAGDPGAGITALYMTY